MSPLKDAKEGATATDAGREFQVGIVRGKKHQKEFVGTSSSYWLLFWSGLPSCTGQMKCQPRCIVNLEEHRQLSFGPSGLQGFVITSDVPGLM